MRRFAVLCGSVLGGSVFIDPAEVIEPYSITCDREVIKKAVSEGFLAYVFSTCTPSAAPGGKNMLGNTPPGPFACLVEWADEHPGIIPDEGRCRMSMEFFVERMRLSTPGGFTSPPWSYEDRDPIMISDRFIQGVQTQLVIGSRSGTLTNGNVPEYFIGGGDQCSAQTIRVLAEKGLLAAIINAYNGADPVSNLVNPDTDLGDALCYDCYHRLWRAMEKEIPRYSSSADTNFASVCSDPISGACLRTTPVANALNNFKICAGYDIFFSGPLCSDEDRGAIDQLSPDPYFVITHCAFNPADGMCSTVDNYLEVISESLGEGCMLCYTEFKNEIFPFAEGAENKIACVNNVHAPICIAAAAKPLTNFLACSGFMINGLN
jgi:hypothetical protein